MSDTIENIRITSVDPDLLTEDSQLLETLDEAADPIRMSDLAQNVFYDPCSREHRLAIAKQPSALRSIAWTGLVGKVARQMTKQENASFTDADILYAAMELEEFHASLM